MYFFSIGFPSTIWGYTSIIRDANHSLWASNLNFSICWNLSGKFFPVTRISFIVLSSQVLLTMYFYFAEDIIDSPTFLLRQDNSIGVVKLFDPLQYIRLLCFSEFFNLQEFDCFPYGQVVTHYDPICKKRRFFVGLSCRCNNVLSLCSCYFMQCPHLNVGFEKVSWKQKQLNQASKTFLRLTYPEGGLQNRINELQWARWFR